MNLGCWATLSSKALERIERETRIEELMRLAREDAERKYQEWRDAHAIPLGQKWADDRWGKNYRVTDNPRSAEDIHD